MRILLGTIFLLVGVWRPERAHAVLPVIDAGVFYFSDSMTYNSSPYAYNRTFWDFMLGMPLSKGGGWVLGWNYDSYSFTDNPGTATTLTVTGMGPKLIWAMDKEKTFTIGFTYNLITTGRYNPGTTATDLRGTSMRVDISYEPEVGTGFRMGPRLCYYRASFTEEITNQTDLAKVTDSRTAIYPALSFTYRFD